MFIPTFTFINNMIKNHTKTYSRIMLLVAVMCVGFTMAGNARRQKTDSTYLRIFKVNKSKSLFKPTLPAIKTYIIPASKPYVASTDDKLLTNVQVFPNPVTDQINVKYSISRDANINIKVIDVLGNEVLTLLSQRVEHGDRKFTYSLSNKLNSGFYFVRIIVGTESIIKRISII